MKRSLNGDWSMAYTSEAPGWQEAPQSEQFTSSLPVPGIWDDFPERFHSFKVQTNPDHKEILFPITGSAKDGSLPFIEGTVWLKQTVELAEGTHILRIGGARLEVWAWVNGTSIGHHLGHSTGVEFPLPLGIQGRCEVMIAVSNLRRDRTGCDLRGFAGRSGGITRSVELVTYTGAHIHNAYLYPDETLEILHAEVSLSGNPSKSTLLWEIEDPQQPEKRLKGALAFSGNTVRWNFLRDHLPLWSDECPHLLKIHLHIRLAHGAETPVYTQTFGIRRLLAEGRKLRLNGNFIFLRGATEHAYFPETTVAPYDPSTYKIIAKRLKALGFNWLRFHTWVPSEEYLNALDEAGILAQIEPPVNSGQKEWEAILRATRHHPSVVILCAGNEECLDEPKISLLQSFAKICRSLVPDLLFNPQEALRGVEYCWKKPDYGSPVELNPFPHNPQRLAWLHEFSDLFGHYPHAQLSYSSAFGNPRKIDHNLEIYSKPSLAHELGIVGTFLDLSLAPRRKGSREGDRIYLEAQKEIERMGYSGREEEIYQLSARWANLIRKHCVENARRCEHIAGYDMLGASDFHWHRYGYPCGIMNEFFELKYGETEASVLRYNGASVLLIDMETQRNFHSGGTFSKDLLVSHYDYTIGTEAELHWKVTQGSGNILKESQTSHQLTPGSIQKLKPLKFKLPELDKPEKLTLVASLQFAHKTIDNQWSIWVFPQPAKIPEKQAASEVTIVSELDEKLLNKIESGSTVLLTGTGGLPARPLSFQISVAGRPNQNHALPLHPHPVWKDFPQEGYCDWQFFSLIEDRAHAIDFTNYRTRFQPILEVVASFKNLIPQAALFEWRIGKGRLLVCTLLLPEGEPAADWLRNSMTTYLEGPMYGQPPVVEASEILEILSKNHQTISAETDKGFDSLGQAPRD